MRKSLFYFYFLFEEGGEIRMFVCFNGKPCVKIVVHVFL